MDPQKQFLVKVSFVGNFLFSENASSAILLALVLGYHLSGIIDRNQLGATRRGCSIPTGFYYLLGVYGFLEMSVPLRVIFELGHMVCLLVWGTRPHRNKQTCRG